MAKPSVGRVVHYMARGSLDGVFPPVCRAATVTEVAEGDAEGLIGIMVSNPTGLFFHSVAAGGCAQDEDGRTPGSWHWPERVDG
jgi:hypothetical protein